MTDEARCQKCGWEGYWDDAVFKFVREPVGEAWGTMLWDTRELVLCPECGSADLVSLEELNPPDDEDWADLENLLA